MFQTCKSQMTILNWPDLTRNGFFSLVLVGNLKNREYRDYIRICPFSYCKPVSFGVLGLGRQNSTQQHEAVVKARLEESFLHWLL